MELFTSAKSANYVFVVPFICFKCQLEVIWVICFYNKL